jgi:hypothetical protein
MLAGLASLNNKVPTENATTGLVTLVGVIVSKRQMSKTLVFADLVPPLEEKPASPSVGSQLVEYR